MKNIAWASASLAVFASGCATAPDKITAASVSGSPYEQWSCARIGEEAAQLSSSLAAANSAQRRARAIDSVGVALFLIPAASLLGSNHADEIAQLKGRQEALAQQAAAKSCAGASIGANLSTALGETPHQPVTGEFVTTTQAHE
jgi:hypothetical protein